MRFIDDYMDGSGKELIEKFWSIISSSRLAFDLYSWIVEEENIICEMYFEKKLPGVILNHRESLGVPNMDVFIKTKSDIIFIESKYTERATKAYINGKKPHLSKAYWDTDKYGKMEIADRFYGRSDIATMFSDFVNEINKDINNCKCPRWFYPKQETTHLFGIIFYLLNGRKENGKYICDQEYSGKIKDVNFYNIFWKMGGDGFKDRVSLPFVFTEKAKIMVQKIFKDSLNFNYGIKTIQNILEESDFHGLNFKDAKTFGLPCSLKEQMKQYEL